MLILRYGTLKLFLLGNNIIDYQEFMMMNYTHPLETLYTKERK